MIETVLLPISAPCSIYRKRKYDKLIKEWYAMQSGHVQRTCDEYFDGAISYASMNAKIQLGFKEIVVNINSNKVNQDNKRNLEIIPKCILGKKRYWWNTVPNKDEFCKLMNQMANSLRLLSDHAEGQIVDEQRLKELLVQCTKICAICQDDEEMLTTNNSEVTSCAHIFHLECLSTWYRQKKECPYCRKAQ